MYHSVTFITNGLWHPTRPLNKTTRKNTWDDWHLIPTSRPVFNPPSVKTDYEDCSIYDGEFDYTESLTEKPTYYYREGSLEFMVENGHRQWFDLYSEIMDFLHGQYGRAILEDDPSYFYEGRFFVKEWRSEPHWSYITIDYKLKPQSLPVAIM